VRVAGNDDDADALMSPVNCAADRCQFTSAALMPHMHAFHQMDIHISYRYFVALSSLAPARTCVSVRVRTSTIRGSSFDSHAANTFTGSGREITIWQSSPHADTDCSRSTQLNSILL